MELSENPTNELLIVADPAGHQPAGRAERGLSDTLAGRGVSAVSTAMVKKNMQVFLGQLRDILDYGKERLGAFEVSRIEVSAQVGGDGRISLLGSGVEISVQGGIKFVLNRLPA
jgi:hypothetical protein